MRTSITKYIVALLQCWSLICLAVDNLPKDIPEIGIKQDYFTGPDAAILSFSVVLAYQPGPGGIHTDIGDGSLIGIAAKAFQEMTADQAGRALSSVTVLAVGNEILIASSQRRLPDTWVQQHGSRPLALALGQAQIDARFGIAHSHADGCGEINVLNLYMQQHPGKTLEGTGASIVTWCVDTRSGEGQGKMGVCDPCLGSQNRYGCWTLLNHMGLRERPPWIRVIPQSTKYHGKVQHFVRWTAMHTRGPEVTVADTQTPAQTINWVGEFDADFFADEEYGG